MTVHRLLSEATSMELELWRRFLAADAAIQEDRRQTADLERRLNAG